MGIENPVHLLFLAAVALVVLGPKRLPELARAAGKGMREFRESLNGEGSEEQPAGAAVVQPTTTLAPQQVAPVQQTPPVEQASPTRQAAPLQQAAPPQQPPPQLAPGPPQQSPPS